MDIMFDKIDVMFYDDTDGSFFKVGSEYLFENILPHMNDAQSIEFDIREIHYGIYGNDDGPYKVVIHNDDYDYCNVIFMDAHELIDWIHYIEKEF